MTMLATLALASLFAAPAVAAQAPVPAPAKVAPMSVQVQSAAGADGGVQAWVKELRAALEARKDEFRLAKAGEKPELLVRVDSVGKAQDGTPVLNAALLLGKTTRQFAYGFTDVKAQAQVLARNLRKFADQMKTAPAAR
jgi:hypothetical protein